MSTAARRAELLEALRTGAGEAVRVTADPRQAIAPCIFLNPVPTRNYTAMLDGLVYSPVWTVVAMVGGSPDLAAVDQLEELQDIVENALEPLTHLRTARAASYAVRGDQPPNFAIVTTLED